MRRSRSEWFYQAKWGLFIHFLAENYINNNENAIEVWNKQVEAFNVEKLASQLNKLNAGYLFLTLGQNSGYFCSPNETYDRLTGRGASESRCSQRDLVADLYKALEKYNIPLMVYLPSHAPMYDVEASMNLKCVPPWNYAAWSVKEASKMLPAQDVDPRIKTFMRNWEAVIREWSLRWGNNVHGWWFDGCYYSDKLFNHPDEPNFSSCAAAVRAGNPESMVCWNPGITDFPKIISSEEDYSSGENNEPQKAYCLGRWIRQAQAHILSYMGHTWGHTESRFSAAEMVNLTRNIVDNGGVFSWDVPYDYSNGTLTSDIFDLLLEFSQGMNGPRTPRISSVPICETKLISKPGSYISGRTESGIAELIISNPCDDMISGTMDFRFSPESAFEPLLPLDYALSPGESISQRVNITPVKPDNTLFAATLSASCNEFQQNFDFPCLCDIDVSDITKRFYIENSNGEKLGCIGLELKAKYLKISATIYDPEYKAKPTPWEGSCLEVFMMPEQDFERMIQLFITPPGIDSPAALLRNINDSYVPVSEGEINAVATSEGYELMAKIPLGTLNNPKRMSLEMQLSVWRPEGYIRKSLFGSPLAVISPEFYVKINAEKM